MTCSSGASRPPFSLRLRGVDFRPPVLLRRKLLSRLRDDFTTSCCCSEPNRRSVTDAGRKGVDKTEEWQSNSRKNNHKVRAQAAPAWRFASSQPQIASRQEKYFPHCTSKSPGPQSRDTPPKRDTGIANAKDWGINLLAEQVNESGINEDGSNWYRESGEDLGENGYRCRWAKMGGQSSDGSSKWKEAWWEKSDWTGYKELCVEKSGSNSEGESWWETWREVLHQDEWSNIARIERSAQKQAKSGTENAGWYENWWEKYDAKGWTEKGAHKYGRLNEQSWWEKWGEHYDGRGSVLKWTDKWAETEVGTKWGDKWEEKFFGGVGSRQGETWHVNPAGQRWSRTWGEEHFGNGKVHKYGKSTTGESWDTVVNEETHYEGEPHYGWGEVIGESSQLLSIEPQDKPPGGYPFPDFGSSSPQRPQGSGGPPPQDGDPPPIKPPTSQ